MKWPHALVLVCWGIVPIAVAQDGFNPFATPRQYLEEHGHAEASTNAPVEFTLKAVMPSSQHPLANISGQLLGIGDSYLGYEIVEITHAGLWLQRDDERLELRLRPMGLPRQGQSVD